MLVSSIPYKFAEPWANAAGGSYITNPIPDTGVGGAASQSLGFPPITATPIGVGGIPPNISDFNGVLSYLSLWARWLQAGGPVFYDATFSTNTGGYPNGAVVRSTVTPGVLWRSTADNNTTDPDGGSPANWTSSTAVGGVLTGNLPNPGIVTNLNLPGSPTTTTQASGTANTAIATTAFVNPGGSLVYPSGYRVNPDGTIDQWMVVSAIANSTPAQFTMPIAVTTGAISIIANYESSLPPQVGNVGADPYSSSQVSIVNTGTAGTHGVNVRIVSK